MEAQQPIELIIDRPRFPHDALEAVRRHAKTSRHADAINPRKLPQMCALAANESDLRRSAII
jgi:hypothetical protein